MFPSPIGVLYISIKFCRDNLSVVDGFRPLLGFFIFQSSKMIMKKGYEQVSVPYWGSLYFNPLNG